MHKITVDEQHLMYSPLDSEDLENEISSITNKVMMMASYDIPMIVNIHGDGVLCLFYKDKDDRYVMQSPIYETAICEDKNEVAQYIKDVLTATSIDPNEPPDDVVLISTDLDIWEVVFLGREGRSGICPGLVADIVMDLTDGQNRCFTVEYQDHYIILSESSTYDEEVYSISISNDQCKYLEDGTPEQAAFVLTNWFRNIIGE